MKKSKTARKPSAKPLRNTSKRAKPSAANAGSSRRLPPEEFGEKALHMNAWQWLEREHPTLLAWHTPNGELRHIAVAEKLKRMGVLPGVADFLCFTLNRKVAIELKDDDGEQSDDQIRFEKRWRAIGGEYHICRTLDAFKAIVNAIALFG